MLSPSYGTDNLDDDVIMTYPQISLFNEKNNRLVSSGKGENVSLKGIEDTIDGRIVSELEAGIQPAFFYPFIKL